MTQPNLDRFQNAEPDAEKPPEPFECAQCDTLIMEDDMQMCFTCSELGCSKCLIHDKESDEYFCDTASTKKLEDSECYQEFKKKRRF